MKKVFRKNVNVLSVLVLIASSLVLSLSGIASTKVVQAAESPKYRNVMYYGDWSIWGGEENFYPKDIPADQLTHLNFAFLDFDGNGNLKFTDKDAAVGAPVGQDGVQWNSASSGILNAIQDVRAKNPNLKIGVSIGGWSKSGDFSDVAANPTIRANFVNNIAKFIKYTNMDFVDLDWEYPASVREPDKVDNTNDEGTPHAKPADKQNFITLLQEIRTAIDKQGKDLGKTYELSVALPAAQNTLKNGVDVAQLFNVVDFANVMTYDMNGAWTPNSAHHTALYGNPADPNYASGFSVDQTVKYLQANGALSSKIVIGAAFYTRGWNKVAAGTDTQHPGLFQAAEKNNKDADLSPTYGANNKNPLKSGDGGRAGGVWPYRNIADLKVKSPDLKEYWDDVAKAPYMYSQTTGEFYTYDNTRSIGYKAEYVKNNQLGGVISWMQSQDKTTDTTKRDELTKAIKAGLFGATALPANKTVYADLNVKATIAPYSENGVGYEITIKNNESAGETGDVLTAVEAAFETVKLPKLYIPVNAAETLTAGDYKAGTVTTTNGFVVVDLSSVYDAQQIPQGASYTFRLKSSAAATDVNRISSIELSQRIAKNGAELSRQTIYGGGIVIPDPSDTTPPTVPGNLTAGTITETAATLTWTASTDNVKLAGYKIYRDGVLVGTVSGTTYTDTTLKANTTYSYTVKAYDAAGNLSADSNAVSVKTKESTTPPVSNAWDASKAYNGGEIVTYQGKTYKAKWWTQGNVPGTEEWGPWELIG
ncbi:MULTISPECIES: glycosyl hydrolase family 18 protein [unclassified Enterococcus]|uniref:glycosyl hydrolase family 18 protein n=1 Tax=unclassified Enterococcus TaxID=2608891 RepID=UPI001CE1279E|nr:MULTISPECIES: glycosyl hydrolase family 18 protein [unclassified Enterococcus]MCA5012198.1 fibronectin type III domain-containing protein [Enterococcus sp. S23]MCA5015449.1 fibronectin type III domain-containing protein [Enterococcus sp. S22(2020)]